MSNLRFFLSIFSLVFVAELGDKTQFASFSHAAREGELFSVILGASLAFILTSLLAVVFGHKLARHLPKRLMKIISGLLFLATGVVLLVRLIFT